MIVAVMTFNLYIPGSASLKAKRSVLRKLKDRLKNNYNISIAETDYQDKWQRTQIGIALVGNDYRFLDECMTKIFNMVDSYAAVEILDHTVEYL